MATLVEDDLTHDHPLVTSVFGMLDADIVAKTIFINSARPKMVCSTLVSKTDTFQSSLDFDKYIRPNLSFHQCLSLSTLYFQCKTDILKEIFHSEIKCKDDFAKFVLTSTEGFLIYSFQFETLAQAVLGITLEQAIECRKAINKHRPIYDILKVSQTSMKYFDALVKRHMITRTVAKPNFTGALNLFNYVKSIR